MSMVKIERSGGVGGFGGPHLKSRGECSLADLSATDRTAVESLFASKGRVRGVIDNSQLRDGFRYRITRQTATGSETIMVEESKLPSALLASIRDVIE